MASLIDRGLGEGGGGGGGGGGYGQRSNTGGGKLPFRCHLSFHFVNLPDTLTV